jgi:hypothetical protein
MYVKVKGLSTADTQFGASMRIRLLEEMVFD